MEPYTLTVTMNLNNLISEAREIAQVMDEFADNLERIENKYHNNELNNPKEDQNELANTFRN